MIVPGRLFRPAWPLVACLAVAMFWPLSEVAYGWAAVPIVGRTVTVATGPGWFAFAVEHAGPGARSSIGVGRITRQIRADLTHSPVFSHANDYHFWCPLWLVSASAGTFAAGLLVSRSRRPHVKAGHCRQCGYDLRASPGQCPECGLAA